MYIHISAGPSGATRLRGISAVPSHCSVKDVTGPTGLSDSSSHRSSSLQVLEYRSFRPVVGCLVHPQISTLP